MKIKKILSALMAGLCAAAMLSGCAKTPAPDSSSQPITDESDVLTDEPVTTFSDVNDAIDTTLSAIDFVKGIKLGWNLGNTLDATGSNEVSSETSWGNPKTSEDLFLAVKDAGFNAIRIPTTWGNHMDENHTIDPEWMKRVTEVVDYAYKNDMYVILNMHHEDWNYPYDDNKAAASEIMTAAWTQIATNFAGYDERLIFEGMNEPRWVGTNQEWSGGNEEGWRVVNELGQVFVDAVRATGGNNASRFLMTPGYAASADERALRAIVVPTDPANRVIVSVHAYTPYSFALQKEGGGRWLADKSGSTGPIDQLAQVLDELFISKGVAVIIGETGAMNKYITDKETDTSVSNENYRADWAEYFTSKFKAIGIPCFLWDNNAFFSGETFGIFERSLYTCRYPDYVAAAVRGAES